MAETPGDAKLGAAGAHLMEFSEKMQQREATEQRGPAKVIQLPLWPEAKRGAPNAVLRSALFAAIQGKGRRYLEGGLLAAQGGITVRYTGARLDQSDLDVWEQALHLARMQALGSRCYFTAPHEQEVLYGQTALVPDSHLTRGIPWGPRRSGPGATHCRYPAGRGPYGARGHS